MVRFAKRPRANSVKQCALNLRAIIHEASLGRVVNIRSRKHPIASLVRLNPKDRIALAHRPRSKTRTVLS